MSLASKMKEMEEANAVQNEQIATLEASVAEKTDAMEAMVAEHEAKVTELSAQVTELEEAKASDEVKSEESAKAMEEIKAELETAKATLASPAHKDASAEGEEAVEPGEPEGDQVAVAEKSGLEQAQEKIAEYTATVEGPERSSWLQEHGAELQAAFNLVNVEG